MNENNSHGLQPGVYRCENGHEEKIVEGAPVNAGTLFLARTQRCFMCHAKWLANQAPMVLIETKKIRGCDHPMVGVNGRCLTCQATV